MSDFESETQPLLKPGTPAKYSRDIDESYETETTDDECEEFVDCGSDHSQYEDAVQELKTKDDMPKIKQSVQPQGSASTSGLKWDRRREAYRFFNRGTQSSSDDTNKTSSTGSSVDLGCVIGYTTDESGRVDYVDIDFEETVGEKNIARLMNKLRLNHYTSVSCEGDFTLSKCKSLFERDYYCEVIENYGGNLCQNYPPRLIIPVARKSAGAQRLDPVQFDTKEFGGKVKRSVSSRLRTRFVVPVILFDKKFICRSGSLTVRKTAVFETARQKEAPKSYEIAACKIQLIARKLASSLSDWSNRGRKAATQLFVPSSIGKLRDIDAQLMRDLNIQHICDLMVEDRKKFKQTIRVSSSEKINKDIYRDCEIEQMPYPGCSFFQKYHKANHVAENLVFDWKRRDVNTEMKFSDDPYALFPDINWASYKEWDIIELTKNYMKMLLVYLVKDPGGLLVHCISGWDRTPLFISMLRVSLWADGVIHESLNYRDMAYLTLAYDWYLFGHDLPRRLGQKQEIMRFCFHILDYISTNEFSVTRIFHDLPEEQKRGRTFLEFDPERRNILKLFNSYALQTYDEYIAKKME